MGWTIIAVAFLVWLVLVVFFTPRINYRRVWRFGHTFGVRFSAGLRVFQ